MESNTFAITVSLVALLIALLSSATAIYYRQRSTKLSSKLSGALQKLAAAHQEMQSLEQRYQETVEFQKNLGEAELTTRLQKPRLSAGYSQQSTAPERYLYVRSLAQSGMEAPESATVLSISTQEAEQLVNLSRLAVPPEEE